MSEDTRERVLRLLAESPFIEGHNDAPIQLRERSGNDLNRFDLHSFDFEDTSALEPPMHTDLKRLRAGCVGAQFWVAYVPFEVAGPGCGSGDVRAARSGQAARGGLSGYLATHLQRR